MTISKEEAADKIVNYFIHKGAEVRKFDFDWVVNQIKNLENFNEIEE